MDAGCLWRGRKQGAGWKALLARLLAPFARRDAEPLLEDAAEMGEVVKAPREGDLADMPGLVRGVAKVATSDQYSRGMNFSISSSRSQTSRSATDCTRPAERAPGSLRHSTGDRVKPTR